MSVKVADDVASILIRGVAAFVRATMASELPRDLRPVAKLTHERALERHKGALLRALDDDVMRARLSQWLAGGPGLRRSDAELLRIAVDRPQGWQDELAARSKASSLPSGSGPDRRIAALEARVGSERDKVRKARAEASKAKEDKERLERAHAAEVAALTGRVSELTEELQRAQERAATTVSDEQRTRNEAARERRRSRRQLREASGSSQELKDRMRALRSDNRRLQAQIEDLSGQIERINAGRRPMPGTTRAGRPSPRTPLQVPKGLLADAPETFEAWMKTPGVSLLVDGYNVTKAPGGFGDLTLENQRKLLLDSLTNIARRFAIEATIVYDGSEVRPGVARVTRGPVKVEYSSPHETADDHVIAKLAAMPAYPVVVVTSDRELQRRAGSEGATIASSPQLLALLR